jgi:hypothetical protein
MRALPTTLLTAVPLLLTGCASGPDYITQLQKRCIDELSMYAGTPYGRNPVSCAQLQAGREEAARPDFGIVYPPAAVWCYRTFSGSVCH